MIFVDVILSEEMRRKISGETLGNALSEVARGRKWKEERSQDIIVNQGKENSSPDWG